MIPAPITAVYTLQRSVDMLTVESISRGIAFLADSREADGSWVEFRTRSSGSSTSWVTGYIAYLLRNAIPTLVAEPDAYLRDTQRTNGGWGFNEAVPADADSTAFCLLAASDGLTPEAVNRARTFLLRHQVGLGGFSTFSNPQELAEYRGRREDANYSGWCSPTAEVTASCVLALLETGSKSNSNDICSAEKHLLRTQLEDGRWSSYWWVDDLY